MVTHRPGDPGFDVVGALFLEPLTGGGVRPHRLPESALERVPGAFMRAVVDLAAGVRLRFHTRATSVTLVAAMRTLEVVGVGPFVASVDLLVDGVLVESRRIDGARMTLDPGLDLPVEHPAVVQRITFDGMADRDKAVEIWLPHSAVVDLYELETDRPIESAPSSRPRWVHHGSSISHCLEADHPTGMWPAVAAAALDVDLVSLGFAGSAVLDPFVARAIRDQTADLITLKLGINLVNADLMKMRAFVPAVHGFLDTIRDAHRDTPIVVISPILCPAVETRPGPTVADPLTGLTMSAASDPPPADALTLSTIRDALRLVVEQRAVADPHIAYLDGRALFDEADVANGHLPDGLHPDARGYELMGERFARLLPPLLTG